MFAIPMLAIVRRELAANLRRTRTFCFVLVLLCLAVMVTIGAWPRQHLTVQEMAAASKQLITMLTVLLLYGCAMVVPALGAASITVEREQDTFDLLYLSLIRPRSILLGKLFNTCGVYLCVVLATLPVFGTALFTVGLDSRQLLFSFAILFVLALYCGTIGILMSTLFRRGIVALIAAYILVIVLMGGPRFLLAALFDLLNVGFYGRYGFGGFPGSRSMSLFNFYSPVGTTYALLDGRINGTGVIAALVVQLTIIGAGLILASHSLRRQAAPKSVRAETIIDDAAVLEARRKQFPYYLIDPSRRRPCIEDGRNPMLVREIRWGLFAKGTSLVRVFYVTTTVFGFVFIAMTMFANPSRYSQSFAIGISLELLTLVSFAPVIMANCFTKERELGNIDMLRMTLLRPRDIVRGKAIAGLFTLMPLLVAIAIAAIPVFFVETDLVGMVLAFYATMPICALMAVSLGLLISLLSRRTHAAIAGGILLNAVCFFGLGLLLYYGCELYQSINSRQIAYEHLIAYASLIGGYYAAFSDSNGLVDSWVTSQALYIVLAVLILRFSEWLFHARHMRDV